MPSSRTGTAKWKQLRKQVIRRARANGVTNCPECGITLDYDNSKLRNSAEVDHIIAYANGGKDQLSNLRICCRFCNMSLGSKVKTPRPKREVTTEEPPTSQDW